MASLPLEIIDDEILPKLPVKSLIRFKSISKQFQSLISSPNFTILHLTASLSSDANRFVIISLRHNAVPHFIDLDNPKNPPSPLPLPASFEPDLFNPILGTCNGLLLLRPEHGSHHLLINPFTGFYSIFSLPIETELNPNYAIGYDSCTDDYKILAIETTGDILIYSVNNELWSPACYNKSKDKEITMNAINLRDAVVFNCRLFHWLIWCSELNRHRIICFDVCIEKWTKDVSLPNYDDSSSDSNRHFADYLFEVEKDKREDVTKLRVFEGCLSVLAESTVHDSFDVWVMKEYGVVGSWVRLFTVPDRHCAPLAYARGSSSKVLLHKERANKKGQLIWYDIRTKHSKKADVHCVHGYGYFYQACMFKGSLVSLPDGKRVCEDKVR